MYLLRILKEFWLARKDLTCNLESLKLNENDTLDSISSCEYLQTCIWGSHLFWAIVLVLTKHVFSFQVLLRVSQITQDSEGLCTGADTKHVTSQLGVTILCYKMIKQRVYILILKLPFVRNIYHLIHVQVCAASGWFIGLRRTSWSVVDDNIAVRWLKLSNHYLSIVIDW